MALQAVRLLPRFYRQPLTLYYMGGYSIGQIAGMLRTSQGAVKRRLSRGRAELGRAGSEANWNGNGQHARQRTSISTRDAERQPRPAGMPDGSISCETLSPRHPRSQALGVRHGA